MEIKSDDLDERPDIDDYQAEMLRRRDRQKQKTRGILNKDDPAYKNEHPPAQADTASSDLPRENYWPTLDDFLAAQQTILDRGFTREEIKLYCNDGEDNSMMDLNDKKPEDFDFDAMRARSTLPNNGPRQGHTYQKPDWY